MKHRSKRLAALGLSLLMALSLIPAALAAEAQPERGTLTYSEYIAPQYEDARQFSDGLAAVKKNGKWGYIDYDNNVVIDFQYDYAWDFNEGYAIVGSITKTLDQVRAEHLAEYDYDYYEDYTFYAEVTVGFIDRSGKYTAFTNPEAEEVYNEESYEWHWISGPLTATFYEEVYTYTWTDENGVEQTETEYYYNLPDERGYIFHNGVALMDFSSDTIYHPNGQGYVIHGSDPEDYEHYYCHFTGPMNEGLIPIQSGDWEYFAGFCDAYGNVVKSYDRYYFGEKITDEWGYEDQSYSRIYRVYSFNQGLAPAYQTVYRAGSDWDAPEEYAFGFIDRNYRWVIEPQYSSFFYSGLNTTNQLFGETGLAMVSNPNGLYGAINKNGETVIPFQYEELWPINNGMIVFMQNGKCGFLDAATLEVAIPAQYEKASGFSSLGLAVVYDGQKAFLIDKDGNAVPGADKLDPDTYFMEDEDGAKSVYSPAEYVVIEENGKYGFGHIEYLAPLPEPEEMSSWAYEEVCAAIEENLVPSYLQNLYLNNITRDEFCDLTMQAISEVLDTDIEDLVLERTGKTLDAYRQEYPFIDTTSSNAIAAYALGIINGRGDGIFDPYATITRQEAAALLMRSAKILGMDTENVVDAGFVDGEEVGVWFKDAVNFVYQINVMNGTGNDAFSPLGTYSREQSYMTIYRLFKAVIDNQA